MRIADFKLERYFTRWEFAVSYLLCGSDVESYRLNDLLALADEEGRALWENLSLGYTETAGHPLLRQEIARLYERVEPQQVLTSAGGEEAIFVLMNALLNAGDHVIVTWPGYQSLFEIARALGAEVTLLPLLEEKSWRLDVEDVRQELRANTRLIVINYPHNPTGAQLDQATFEAVFRLAEEAGAYVFSDEAYRFLEYRAEQRLPAAVDISPRGISLGVLSKSFALPGLRAGWLAMQDGDLLRRVAAFKDYTSICSSAPSEILSLIALRAKDAVLARSLGIVQRNLKLLDQFFADWEDVLTWVRPQAGSIAFPRLLQGGPVTQFAQELVEQEGVLLLPATIFDHPADHFRIGFGRLNMPEALAHLERFLIARFT